MDGHFGFASADTQQVQINTEQLWGALRDDPEFLIHFFLRDEITIDVPEFHVIEFKKMTRKDILKYCCAMPRDHAKTTLARLAVIWHFLFSQHKFVLYISSVLKLAVASVNAIAEWLEDPNLQGLIHIDWKKKQDGVGHYEFDLTIMQSGQPVTKSCIMLAAGAGQSLRGMNIDNKRPDLAVVDDLEKKEDIEYNEEAYRQLKKWFYGTFRKALNKFYHKIIQIGNIVANKCLVKDHCNSPFWHSTKYGCILESGEPLWPGAWTIESLQADFHEYELEGMLDVWFAEMMNEPTEGKSKLIQLKDIFFRELPHPRDVEYAFIICDPAISDKKWAHKCAISVHGFVDGCWQLVDYKLGTNIDPIQMRQFCHELCYKWRAKTIGIEAVAYQTSLQSIFPYLDMVEGVDFFDYVPLRANAQKGIRIASWAAMIKNQSYALTSGDMTTVNQLLNFDPKDKDGDNDLIDTGGYVPQMLQEFAHFVYQRLDVYPNQTVQTSYEVCDI